MGQPTVPVISPFTFRTLIKHYILNLKLANLLASVNAEGVCFCCFFNVKIVSPVLACLEKLQLFYSFTFM